MLKIKRKTSKSNLIKIIDLFTPMKEFITIFFLIYLLGSISFTGVKRYLPAGSIQTNTVIDLNNSGNPINRLIIPEIMNNTLSFNTSLNRMLVYDLASNCTKMYDNGAWSNCLSTTAFTATVNCALSNLNGNYYQSTALTASNTVTILVNNNSSTLISISPSTTDINLSGTAAEGMSITDVSPATLTVAANSSSTITYTLSGIPTTLGSFTATWTKLDLTCVKTGNVCVYISPITVTSTYAPLKLPIPTEAGNEIYFKAAGGTPNTGITWAITSIPSTGVFSSPASGTGINAKVILVAGVYDFSISVTYTITNGCSVLTATNTVNIEDQLRVALSAGGCTSCAAYDAAAADTWVNITAAEYTRIDNYIPINIGACNEFAMNAAGTYGSPGWTWLSLGSNVSQLPANNYVIAFSTINVNGVASNTGYVKYSRLQSSGFTMGGPTLNVDSMAAQQRIYFIMKKPSAVINALYDSYVAYYSGVTMQVSSIVLGDMNFNTVDDSLLPYSYYETIKYQIKSTASKRW